MNKEERELIINNIVKREQLRTVSRFERLLRDPIRVVPYYFLATLAKINPFKINFKTPWGDTMSCYMPEGNTFYYYGYCEANLTNFFLRFIKKDMVCIDVGAHIGIYTSLFSALTKNVSNVHSFEPTPWTFSLLKNNIKDSKINLNNTAVSETNKILTFSDYGKGYGAYNSAHNIGSPALKIKPSITEVESVSLDQYCLQNNIEPDIIKIDSEGFEFEVLSGAKNILSNYKNKRPLISIEVANEEHWGSNIQSAVSLLEENSYISFSILVDGYIKKHIKTVTYEYDNLLFIPKERINELENFVI